MAESDEKKGISGIDISRAARDTESLSESDATLLRTLMRNRGLDEEDADFNDVSIEEITISTGRFVIPTDKDKPE